MMEQLSDDDLEQLRHMVGIRKPQGRVLIGYRNHYCAGVGSADHAAMVRMEQMGIVMAGRVINDGRDQYFHVTLKGCQVIGLTKAATKRALEDFIPERQTKRAPTPQAMQIFPFQ